MIISRNNSPEGLPNGWSLDRLKDVSQINGASLPADTNPAYEFDYLEISNVDYNGIVDPSAIERIRYEDAPSRARRRVTNNCTVISSVRPNLQAVAFLDNRRNGLVCSTGFNVVSPRESKLWPRFIYYVLISEWARQYFDARAKGVGYPAVDDKDFDALSVPLPPIPEQERIARFLDNACAFVDEAVATKQRQLEMLNEMQESAITNAVTAGLKSSSGHARLATSWFRHSPTHWEIRRLKDVVRKFVDYRGRTPEKTREGIPLVTARNIRRGRIDFSDSQEFIAEEDYDAWMVRGLPKKGDVLITTEAPMGEVAAVEDEHIALAQRIVLLKANHRMTNEYLRYFFLSAAGSAEIRRYATGSTALGIKARWLKLINVLVPPVDEQRAIAAYLDQYCARLEPLIHTIGKQIDILLAYRKSLIHECVTGQRRVTEADVNKIRAHA